MVLKKIIDALNIIKPPFNVSLLAQLAAVESLKDSKFIEKSIKHNLIFAKKIKSFLERYQIFSNTISANFLLLDFKRSNHSAKEFYEKTQK
jgi:histidinol-phosphate aminotransferase